ncbi:DUF7563 family protein [Halohasta litorea]|uniref:DUF7563 family protein n=1 Tax=Haloferacaceae TaxID=1644056 RepID=UPI003CCE03B4
MPTCENCESHVTDNYVRVFTPDGLDNPRACPQCDDLIRHNGQIRKARTPRF